MQKNGLIRKLWLISKSMMSLTGRQIITTYILPNISRTKDNQKFGQLMKHSVKSTRPLFDF